MQHIPNDVKTLLDERGYTMEPALSVRSLNSLSGELGEAYLLLNDEALLIVSRQVGKPFSDISLPLKSITGVELREDRPFAYLNFIGDGSEYSLKFSGLDIDILNEFSRCLSEHDQNPSTSPVAPSETPAVEEGPVELTPVIGFCAAVYAMIQADSSIDDEELDLLNQLIDHPPTVLKGLDALRRLGTVELLNQLNELMDERQKLCMIANLAEMAMVDGLVRGKERRLLSQVREAVGVEKENFDAIFEVLMIKNDRSIFEISD